MDRVAVKPQKIKQPATSEPAASWTDSNLYLWSACMLLALATMAFLVLRYYPHFETNDDMAACWIVNGIKGSYDPHVIIQSTLLGYIYCFFYNITWKITWYSVIQYVVILFSLAAIGFAVRRLMGRIGWLCYALVLVFGGYEAFIAIQYTKASGLAAIGGTLLLLVCYQTGSMTEAAAQCVPGGDGEAADLEAGMDPARVSNSHLSKGLLVYAYMLLALAFMYRENITVVCMGLLSPAVLCFFLEDKRQMRAKLRRAAVMVAAVLVMFGLLHAGYKLSFHNADWENFYDFDDPRVQLLDYGMPSYDANAEELEALGIDSTAYAMFTSWCYTDPEVFTAEVLQAMADMKEPVRYVSKTQVKNYLKQVPKTILSLKMAVVLYIAFLWWLIASRHSLRNILLAGLSFCFLGGVYYILFCQGRWAMNRIGVPMLMAQALCLFLLTRPTSADTLTGRIRIWGTGAAAVLILAAFFTNRFGNYQTLRRGSSTEQYLKQTGDTLRSYLEMVTEDTEHFYTTTTGTLVRDNCYGPFDVAKPGLMTNFVQLGGWAAYTAQFNDLCEEQGITNPMRCGIDNPDIICADNHIDLTVAYLEKHMGVKIGYEHVEAEEISIGDVPLYRLFTVKEEES